MLSPRTPSHDNLAAELIPVEHRYDHPADGIHCGVTADLILLFIYLFIASRLKGEVHQASAREQDAESTAGGV